MVLQWSTLGPLTLKLFSGSTENTWIQTFDDEGVVVEVEDPDLNSTVGPPTKGVFFNRDKRSIFTLEVVFQFG